MKQRAQSFLFIFMLAALAGCSLENYSSKPRTELRIRLPERESKIGALSNINSDVFDCIFADVNGSGLDKMFNAGELYESFGFGYASPMVQVDGSQPSVTILIPTGRARMIRLIGVNFTPKRPSCDALTFKGHPYSGVLASAEPPSSVREIGRVTADVLSTTTVTLVRSPIAELMPAGVTDSAAPSFEFSTGNADNSYSEGRPPSSAYFVPVVIAPQEIAYTSLVGPMRYDLLVPLSSAQRSSRFPFQGLVVSAAFGAGDVPCSGPEPRAISAKSSVTMGVWDEANLKWHVIPAAFPATDQTFPTTAQVSGFDLSKALVPTNQGDMLYLSFRLDRTPATGCSTFRPMSLSLKIFK